VFFEIYILHAGHDHPASLRTMADEADILARGGKKIEAETMFTNLLQPFEKQIRSIKSGGSECSYAACVHPH
jgi:hypothetical protein